MPAGSVIKSVKDAIAVVLGIFESAENEVVFLTPPSFVSLAGSYGTIEGAKRFIQNGGVLRGIIPISRANI